MEYLDWTLQSGEGIARKLRAHQMDTSPSDSTTTTTSDINSHSPQATIATSQSNNSSQLLNHLLLTSPSVLDVALSITSSIIPSDTTNSIMMDLDESVYELITNNMNDDRQQSQGDVNQDSNQQISQQQQQKSILTNDSNCSCSCLNKVDETSNEISSVCDSVWPSRLDSLCRLPMPSFETQLRCTWNPSDSSEHIYVQSGDPFTFHRHPTAQSTDCIRGGQGFSRGLHVWRIRWKSRQRGTHAVIGVCTDKAPLQTPGYKSLVGSNTDSWGWDITRCRVMHNVSANGWKNYPVLHNTTNNNNNIKESLGNGSLNNTNNKQQQTFQSNNSNTPSQQQQQQQQFTTNSNNSQNNPIQQVQTLSVISNLSKKPDFIVPEYIMVILDMEEGTLSFAVNNQFLGVAFRGLSGKTLYPCVSAVWGHCEVTMNYLGGLNPAPLTLSQACRSVIRRQLLTTLNHHKSVMNNLQQNNDVLCDVSKSGLTANQSAPLINHVTISNALTNNNPIIIKTNQQSQQNGIKKPLATEIKGKCSSDLLKSRQLSLSAHSFDKYIKGCNLSLSKLVNCLSLPYSLIDFLLYRPQFINYAEVSQQTSHLQLNINNNNNNCTSSFLQTQYHSQSLQLPFQHIFSNVHQSSLLNSQQAPATHQPPPQPIGGTNTTTTSSNVPHPSLNPQIGVINSTSANTGSSTSLPPPPAPTGTAASFLANSSPINWSSSPWNNVLNSSITGTNATDIRWSNLMVDPHSFVKRIVNQTTASTTANSAINRPTFNNHLPVFIAEDENSPQQQHPPPPHQHPQVTPNNEIENNLNVDEVDNNIVVRSNTVCHNDNQIS